MIPNSDLPCNMPGYFNPCPDCPLDVCRYTGDDNDPEDMQAYYRRVLYLGYVDTATGRKPLTSADIAYYNRMIEGY